MEYSIDYSVYFKLCWSACNPALTSHYIDYLSIQIVFIDYLPGDRPSIAIEYRDEDTIKPYIKRLYKEKWNDVLDC